MLLFPTIPYDALILKNWIDFDNDGVFDTEDLCPNTMEGITVGSTGCPIFELPSNNFEIEIIGETCPNKKNDQIIINSLETNNYVTTEINGSTYSFTKDKTIDNLPDGVYNFCISVEGQSYEQCFTAKIEAGTTLLAKTLFASDELAGFIFAVTYVRPSKSILEVKVKSVTKKLKDKGFAAKVSREDINYGITYTISTDEIIEFLKENEALLLQKGFNFNYLTQ